MFYVLSVHKALFCKESHGAAKYFTLVRDTLTVSMHFGMNLSKRLVQIATGLF